MDKDELEKMVQQHQAGAEQNLMTIRQIVGVATPGLVTHFLQLVQFQVEQNIRRRTLEGMP